MKFSKIQNAGYQAGREDVRGFYEENGADEFIKAAKEIYAWDESAINAGVHKIVCGINRVDEALYNAFYKAYNDGAKFEESAILKEIE